MRFQLNIVFSELFEKLEPKALTLYKRITTIIKNQPDLLNTLNTNSKEKDLIDRSTTDQIKLEEISENIVYENFNLVSDLKKRTTTLTLLSPQLSDKLIWANPFNKEDFFTSSYIYEIQISQITSFQPHIAGYLKSCLNTHIKETVIKNSQEQYVLKLILDVEPFFIDISKFYRNISK